MLVNVALHSGASAISVKLLKEGSKAVLILEDNGKGFPLSILRQAPTRPTAGLVHAMEIANATGGAIQIETRPDGTWIKEELPAQAWARWI